METRKFGAFSSSEDPQKLADTVKGVIVGLSSVIIYFAGQFNLPLAETEVAAIASQLGIAVASIWTLYGFIKKLVVKLGKATV